MRRRSPEGDLRRLLIVAALLGVAGLVMHVLGRGLQTTVGVVGDAVLLVGAWIAVAALTRDLPSEQWRRRGLLTTAGFVFLILGLLLFLDRRLLAAGDAYILFAFFVAIPIRWLRDLREAVAGAAMLGLLIGWVLILAGADARGVVLYIAGAWVIGLGWREDERHGRPT